MDLSDAIKEAYAYADPLVTLFDTFEITHPSWSQGIKLVDSDIKLSTPQGIYMPVSIKTSLPTTEGSVRGEMQITLNSLPKNDRNMLYEASLKPDPLFVQYRQYTGENIPPDAELPVSLSVSRIEYQGDFETVITCLYPDLINIPFCRRIMTTTALPGGKI